MRAILRKALAADIQRRYISTQEFADDLRAFLEDRRTVAEDEKLPSWTQMKRSANRFARISRLSAER